MNYGWYIINTVSGTENKVKLQILEAAKKNNLEDLINEIMVPSISVPEVKRGKKVEVEKKLMPGYVFINMVMSEDSWHMVMSSCKNSGFLGGGLKPERVSQKQIDDLKKQIVQGEENATKKLLF